MTWKVTYLPAAVKDLKKLDGNLAKQSRKAIAKVSQNPLSIFDGGYGVPLGNKGGRNLSGLFKIKLRHAGIRIVYKLEKRDEERVIIVVGVRDDDEVYDIAKKRDER